MKRWLHFGGRLLVATLAGGGVVCSCLLIANPADGHLDDWLKNGFARVTGQSVEVRVNTKSKRCAQSLGSGYASARKQTDQDQFKEWLNSADSPEPPLWSPPPGSGLMHRIEQDQRATSEFFSHRAASDPALRKAGDESVFYIDVFTNLIAKEALIRGSGKFPLGSVILKRKSRTPDGKDTEYYTGMRKNGHGYWPEMGDWEFLVLDASGKEAEAGRLVSCSDCHARWAGADFVSRNYFDPCIPGGMKAVIRDEPDEQSR